MGIKSETASDITTITLDESSDISNVDQLFQVFSDALDISRSVVVDLQWLERIDTAAMQLLFAFMKAAKVHDIDVDLYKPSDSFLKSVHLIGMQAVLGLDGAGK